MECDLTNKEFNSQSFTESFASTKRPRKLETIDLRTPVYQRNTKKQEFRNESGKQYHSSVQTKGYKNNSLSYNLQEEGFYKSLVFYTYIFLLDFGGKYAMKECFDPRETPYSANQPATSTTTRKQDGQKQQAYGGASHASRPPAGSGKHLFAKE